MLYAATVAKRVGLLDFPYLILDDRIRNLLRKSEKSAAALAFLIAEASVGIAFAAEEDGAAAVGAFGHGLLLECGGM